MFGNLMGDMEAKQNALREKLSGVMVETSGAGGKIKVVMSAIRQVKSITVDEGFRREADGEEFEDNLILAFNEAILKASQVEAEESQKLLKDLIPPGLENLFG
jgi:nucleoid-associated protein EbfC